MQAFKHASMPSLKCTSTVVYLEECRPRGLSGGATLVVCAALDLKLPDSGGQFAQLSFLGAVCLRSVLRLSFLLPVRFNAPNAHRSDEGTDP